MTKDRTSTPMSQHESNPYLPPTRTVSHAEHHAGDVHPHVAPWPILVGTLAILLVLTALTVYTAQEVDIGTMGNIVLALVIATIKSAFVVGFFMHLHWDNKFNAVVLLFTLLAAATFLVFTIIDLGSRTVVDPTRGVYVEPDIVEKAREAGEAQHSNPDEAAGGEEH